MPWIHCCIFCGLIVLCVGRVHVDSWRRLFAPYTHYLVSDKFCCTQAILYTARTARELAAYLDSTSCNETYHKDDALWKFTTPGHLIQPNVFEHVGVWSTVRHGFVDPHTISWYLWMITSHWKSSSFILVLVKLKHFQIRLCKSLPVAGCITFTVGVRQLVTFGELVLKSWRTWKKTAEVLPGNSRC